MQKKRLQGCTDILLALFFSTSKIQGKRAGKKGGHSIPEDVIERRYKRGLENFFRRYRSNITDWIFLNNSGTEPNLIAQGNSMGAEKILNENLWKILEKKYGNL